MRKLPSRKLLTAIVAGALFVPQSGFTLGLGEIEVNSALNQKLRAEIELLSATPEDAENIIVKLASRKEFSRAGLDRPYSLSDLRFKSVVIGGVPHIQVSTGSPVREPFLNFLVEVDWPNGHLLREYTVLLDPPVFMTNTAAAASSRPASSAATESRPTFSNAQTGNTVGSGSAVTLPATVSSPSLSSAQTMTAPAASKQTFSPAPVVQAQTPARQQVNQPPGSYRIKSGNTTWSLADALRPDQSVTVPQMMFALLRANPESFINENINGLKRGYILRIPDAQQINTISPAEAQAMMKQHWALWRQYLQAQSGGQPVSAMPADTSSNSVAADGDGSAATDSIAADRAQLSIVSAGTGASSGAGSKDPSQMTEQELRAELALARERVESERVEKEALQSQLNSLQQRTENREGLLAIEDEGLSDAQSLDAGQNTASDSTSPELAADEASANTESAALEGASEVAVSDESQLAEDSSLTTESDDTATANDESVIDESTMQTELETVADGVDDETSSDAVFVDEMPGDETAEQGDVASATNPEQVETEDFAPSQVAGNNTEAANPLEFLLKDPKLLAVAGGGLLLIVALIALMAKRRKSQEEETTEVNSDFSDLESLADDIAQVNDEQSTEIYSESSEQAASDEDVVSENATSDELEAPDSEPDQSTAEDESPRDDVMAEADVYLAYGIYQQAEELLNQAISENPERTDYRVKLAETHYAGKNAESFVEAASGLKALVEADSSEWKKVAVMGQDLCGDNPLFQNADADELEMDGTVDEPVMGLDDTDTTELELPVEDISDDTQLDTELELPEMEADEPAEDADPLDEMLADVEDPVEEIEFDISDTGAVDEDDSDDAFDLDIDATELDIDNQDIKPGEDVLNEDELEEETMELDDIDLGLDDVETVAEDQVETEEEISLDLSEEIAAESVDDAAEEAPAIDELVIEEPAIDEPVQDEQTSEPVSGVAADNVVPLDSELADSNNEKASAESKTIPAANDSVDDDFDLSSLDDVDEISTKLDLARAYLDMGDAEGTRGILEEVLVDGNDEQKQEAHELLDKLA